MELVSVEDFVPKDHLLRKINAAVDFDKIYEFVEDLYCHNNGRPSIDPVILFKMVLIQHLYGIPSLRKTAEDVKMKNCPSRYKCTENSKYEKTVTKHIWLDYLETVEDIRHTDGIKELYDCRKETIERVFDDAKEKHGMRFTYCRGLSQVTKWVRLIFATMNLKKYAIHRWKGLLLYFCICFLKPYIWHFKPHYSLSA